MLTAGPGNAPALILLHGWGASKEIWRPALRSPLIDRVRVIALDLPGTGDAAHLSEFAGATEAMADFVAARAEELGLESYSVLGHSMGANVAARVATRFPERVDSLILVSAALHSHRLAPVAQWYLHPLIGGATLGGARMVAGAAGWVESHLPEIDELGWARGYARRSGYLRSRNTRAALQRQLAALVASPVDVGELAPELPVLIVHGERDSTIPVAWAREAAAGRAANRLTRLIIYPEALHCPMDTHAVRFSEDVAEFLGTHPPLRGTFP